MRYVSTTADRTRVLIPQRGDILPMLDLIMLVREGRQSVREIEPEAYRAHLKHLKQGCTSRPGISFNPISSGDAVTSPVRECNTESTPMYVASFISDICGRLKQRNLPDPSMQSFSWCFDSEAPYLAQLEGSKASCSSVEER